MINRHPEKPQLSPTTQTHSMDLKQALAQLIDAYADAKASKNQILLQYATQELQNFIQQVDLIQAPPVRQDEATQPPAFED